MSNDNDTLYLAFKDVKPSWSLIGSALSLGTIATIGIIFHFCVIFVAIRSKSLRGTSNYLLALCSLFELLHQLGHFLFVYTALTGQNFIEYRLAGKIFFLPMFGIGATFPTMFFTGIDRLIGVLQAETINKIKKRFYLAMITVITVLFGTILCIYLHEGIELFGDQMVTGSVIDLFKGQLPFIYVNYNYLIIITSIIYVIVGILIRKKASGLPSAASINQRTFRAMFCIISVNLGGYLIFLFYLCLINPLISSPITSWFAHLITAILLNIGSASNGPILYFTSTDYRKAFQTEFQFVFKRFLNANRTAPQQTVPKRLMTTKYY